MKTKIQWKLRSAEILYLMIAVIATVRLSLPFAQNFDIMLFTQRCSMAASYFGLATVLAVLHSVQVRQPMNGSKTVVAGIVMFASADFLYSIVRHDFILLVLPALFAVPGAVFGSVLATVLFHKLLCKP